MCDELFSFLFFILLLLLFGGGTMSFANDLIVRHNSEVQ